MYINHRVTWSCVSVLVSVLFVAFLYGVHMHEHVYTSSMFWLLSRRAQRTRYKLVGTLSIVIGVKFASSHEIRRSRSSHLVNRQRKINIRQRSSRHRASSDKPGQVMIAVLYSLPPYSQKGTLPSFCARYGGLNEYLYSNFLCAVSPWHDETTHDIRRSESHLTSAAIFIATVDGRPTRRECEQVNVVPLASGYWRNVLNFDYDWSIISDVSLSWPNF